MADPVSLGITVGLTLANMALTASRKIEGPRQDTVVTSGDYGAELARVYGLRRIHVPIFWAEDLREVKRKRRTKGGKFAEYTYFGTWAVALAAHEIAAVRRIWFDTHLVFDLTGAGPATPFDFGDSRSVNNRERQADAAIAGGGKGNSFFRIYLGTEDQEPDPRIQAWVEAKHGEGSCPAYRGTAYIVFTEIPLEKLNNHIPTVSVEFASGVEPQVVTETFDLEVTMSAMQSVQFSPDFGRLFWSNGDTFEMWDVAARARMMVGSLGPASIDLFTRVGIENDGSIIATSDAGGKVVRISPDGGSSAILVTTAMDQYGACVVQDGNGVEHWGTYPFSFYGLWYFDGVEYFNGTWRPYHYFADGYGDVWAVGNSPTGSTTVYFQRMVECGGGPGWPGSLAITGLPSSNGEAAAVHVHASGEDFFFLRWEGVHYKIDPATGAILDSVVAAEFGNALTEPSVWANFPPGASTIWGGDTEYSLATLAELRDVGATGVYGNYSIYDPTNHALIFSASDDEVTWFYLDRIDGAVVTLGDIVEDVCTLAGIDAADLDTSDLDQEIRGFSCALGSGKDWLEPLLDVFDADPRPHGFELEFVSRGGAAGAEISSEDFAQRDGKAALFNSKRAGASDVPVEVTLHFADVDGDQQPNTAMSGPIGTSDSERKLTLDMKSLALNVDEARGLVARYHRRLSFERLTVSLALPAQQIALEPADLRTLDLRGVPVAARLASMVLGADRRIETEWVRDDPSVALLDGAAGAAADGRDEDTIVVPLLSKGFVLDVPYLSDADVQSAPIVQLLAAPYAEGSWGGATFLQAVDGEYTEELGSIASSNQATWGLASDVLAAADPWLWDRGNSVNIRLQTGTLSGTTEATIDAAPTKNQALLGDEILNFTTATLEADGSFTLTGLKRGRRGTEWACTEHVVGERFVLLDEAHGEALGLSEVGTEIAFKAVTAGRSEAGAFPIALAPFTGASLKPYAPCHLAAAKDAATDDWALSWTRRTRVGGAWTGGTPIPLSEANEEYEVEILDGLDVVRTITGLSSPAATWTAAQQAADFGGDQAAVHFRIYQISDAVGRGFPAEFASDEILSTRWRMLFTTGAAVGTIELREVEMRAWPGGDDQCHGGTPSASSELGGSWAVAAAFDDVDSFAWTATGNVGEWLEYTFATPVMVREFWAKVNQLQHGPQAIAFQYWDAGAGAWVTLWSVSGLTWLALEAKTFTKP